MLGFSLFLDVLHKGGTALKELSAGFFTVLVIRGQSVTQGSMGLEARRYPPSLGPEL